MKKVYFMNFRTVKHDENSDFARTWFRIQKNRFKIF